MSIETKFVASPINQKVVGPEADGAAAVGAPVQIAGKDGTGKIQTILTDADGKIIQSATVTGSNTVQDDSGNTDTQAKGDDRGVQYIRQVGQRPATPMGLPLGLQKASVGTSPTPLTTKDYLVEEGQVGPAPGNTDEYILVGDEVTQQLTAMITDHSANDSHIGNNIPVGAGLLKNIFLKAPTTAADDADFFGRLVDRPDFRELMEATIQAHGGGYWALEELSGTALINEFGDGDLLVVGATVGDAGVYGRGIDLDGSNDFLRQKTEQAESGTVSGVETNGSAALDDTGAVFSSAIRDGKHWIRVTDAGGDIVHGYIGTTDPDVDDTRVLVFDDPARGTQDWVEGGATAFDMADTPLTFHVFKELGYDPAVGFTVGGWFNIDALSNVVLASKRDTTTPTNSSTFQMKVTDAGTFSMQVFDSGAGGVIVTGTIVKKIGQQVFVVGTYSPGAFVRIYVNGQLDTANTVSVPAAAGDSGEPLAFGARRPIKTANDWLNAQISHPFFIPALMDDNWVRTAYELSRR